MLPHMAFLMLKTAKSCQVSIPAMLALEPPGKPLQSTAALWKKERKKNTSFCQPTRLITCLNYGNHVQVFMKLRQSTAALWNLLVALTTIMQKAILPCSIQSAHHDCALLLFRNCRGLLAIPPSTALVNIA